MFTIPMLRDDIRYWYTVLMECLRGQCDYYNNDPEYIKRIISERKLQLADKERMYL